MFEKPTWLRVRAPTAVEARGMRAMRDVLEEGRLNTICQGAQCPNLVECWSAGTATFLLLGKICTRACRFCGVQRGRIGEDVDPGEAERVASAVRKLGLRHVVLTSVDRDDLPDGGAGMFAGAVEAVKRASPATSVEVLLPDFGGNPVSMARAMASAADVLGHNLETVRRISPELRDARASYERSLEVLTLLYRGSRGRPVKSGLMLGLGEERDEVVEALRDLRAAGVSSLTLGQYLPPSSRAAPVRRYVRPEEFDLLADQARALGFRTVVAGPRVRSSYHAEAALGKPCDSVST
jgi:lipoic acid synthetase